MLTAFQFCRFPQLTFIKLSGSRVYVETRRFKIFVLANVGHASSKEIFTHVAGIIEQWIFLCAFIFGISKLQYYVVVYYISFSYNLK